jgi:hypothetical protein
MLSRSLGGTPAYHLSLIRIECDDGSLALVAERLPAIGVWWVVGGSRDE